MNPKQCTNCGREFMWDSPEDLCPQCIMAFACGSSAFADTEPPGAASFAPWSPPKPNVLQPHFPQLEIIDLIGQGGMGAVYKARQIGLDRIVGLKILPPQFARDPAFAEEVSS